MPEDYLRIAITDREAAAVLPALAAQDRCSAASLVARLVMQEFDRRLEDEKADRQMYEDLRNGG